LPVLWLGSREIAGSWSTLALGVGVDGVKRVLALRPGSVRDPLVAEELLADLVARGLTGRGGLLVVTEGSQTLDRAVKGAWQGRALVAHCRIRLCEEVLAHVPEGARARLRADLRSAWAMPAEAARTALHDLHRRLESDWPGAAERLHRSLEPVLTVARLGVASPLKECLTSAGTLRMAFKNALRWGGFRAQGLRALAAGLPVWLRRTRRLVGWQGLELLARNLRLASEALEGPETTAAPDA
jgi:hypothetical protein